MSSLAWFNTFVFIGAAFLFYCNIRQNVADERVAATYRECGWQLRHNAEHDCFVWSPPVVDEDL